MSISNLFWIWILVSLVISCIIFIYDLYNLKSFLHLKNTHNRSSICYDIIIRNSTPKLIHFYLDIPYWSKNFLKRIYYYIIVLISTFCLIWLLKFIPFLFFISLSTFCFIILLHISLGIIFKLNITIKPFSVGIRIDASNTYYLMSSFTIPYRWAFLIVYYAISPASKNIPTPEIGQILSILICGSALWYVKLCLSIIFEIERIVFNEIWLRKSKWIYHRLANDFFKNFIFRLLFDSCMNVHLLNHGKKIYITNGRIELNGRGVNTIHDYVVHNTSNIYYYIRDMRCQNVYVGKRFHQCFYNTNNNLSSVWTSARCVGINDQYFPSHHFNPKINNSQYMFFTYIDQRVVPIKNGYKKNIFYDNGLLDQYDNPNPDNLIGSFIRTHLMHWYLAQNYIVWQNGGFNNYIKFKGAHHINHLYNNELNEFESFVEVLNSDKLDNNYSYNEMADAINDVSDIQLSKLLESNIPKLDYNELKHELSQIQEFK